MNQPSCFRVFSGRPGIRATIVAALRSLATLLMAASIAWSAEDQEFRKFIENLTTFTSEVDRPVLMVSRGAAIAWIRDPLALPKNFSDYLISDPTLIPVPIGTAMMAFPPRDPKKKCTDIFLGLFGKCPPSPGTDRGTSAKYMLVLTADGLWGVLDTSQAVYFLNESDLKPIVLYQQKNQSSKFFITTAQIKNVDVSADDSKPKGYLPPGQPLLVSPGQPLLVSNDLGESKTVVDIGGDDPDVKKIPAFKNIQQLFRKFAPLRAKFEVDRDKLTDLTILERIVPEGAVKDWENGKVGNYYNTILQGGAFSMVRVSSAPSIIGCDQEQVRKSSWEGKLDSSIKASVKGKFNLLGNGAALETQASAQLKAERSSSTTQTIKSAIWQKLVPVEVVDKDGKAFAFWAGTARNCSGARTWTLMVDNTPPSVEPDAEYLHPNFDQIGKELSSVQTEADGKQQLDAIRTDLEKIEPGGNPFEFTTGAVKFKCLWQAIAFAQMAQGKMAAATPVQVNVVVALATSAMHRQGGNTMSTFARDAACNRS